jgi:hypothetical protein
MSQNGTHAELTSAQRKGLAALLVAKNVREASQASGIAERTLHRWLADARFLLALSSAEGQAIDAATRRLVGLQDKAVGALESILDNPAAHPSLRLRAAVCVLEQLIRLRELRNTEARLAALEEAYAKKL